MSLTSYVLATGLMGLKTMAENNAKNLSSLSVKGSRYKGLTFREALLGNRKDQVSYALKGKFWNDTKQGDLQNTNDPQDLALSGPGFFALEGGNYSRDGHIFINDSGQVVNAHGIPFLEKGGSYIQVPPGASLSIQSDGTVFADKIEVGQFNIVTFPDEKNLPQKSNSLFEGGQQIPSSAENTQILQGFLEQSNVSAVPEVFDMQTTLSSYQSLQYLTKSLFDQEKQDISNCVKIS